MRAERCAKLGVEDGAMVCEQGAKFCVQGAKNGVVCYLKGGKIGKRLLLYPSWIEIVTWGKWAMSGRND